MLFLVNIAEVSFPLYHVMLGGGFPSTGQKRNAQCPSVTTWCPLLTTYGGSKTKRVFNVYLIKGLYIKISQSFYHNTTRLKTAFKGTFNLS